MLTWCREQELFTPGDRVLCAVSGGMDSMALLDLLVLLAPELGITVSAAHFHHGLRGQEADRDAAFVAEYCARCGIPFQCGHGQTARRAAEQGESVEQAARALRYAFLREAAAGGPIATAHTADDHAETILINLVRGTGLRGLCGIPPKQDGVVRPILCLDRTQVRAWMAARNLPHVEDSSNQSRAYLRNRLRQTVLPGLAAEAPSFSKNLLAQSLPLRQDADLLDRQGLALLQRAESASGLQIPVLLDAETPVTARAILFWLRQNGVRDPGQVHVEAVCGLCGSLDGSAQLDLPGSVTILRSYDRLMVLPDPEPRPETQTLPVPGCIHWGPWRIEAALLDQWDGESVPDTWFVSLPDGPLTVRSRQCGDKLRLPGGRKRLNRLMIDRKIPVHLRDTVPVLSCADEIVGVALLGADAGRAAVPGQPALRIHITKERE